MNAIFFGLNGVLTTETINVFQHFSANGYVTGMFKDICDMQDASFDDNATYAPFYHWDHYAISPTCDANFDQSPNENFFLAKGRNSFYRRCLYGHDIADVALGYTTQFWDAYPDVRKFFKVAFNLNHEATGELIRHSDQSFVNFFESFRRKGYLNHTQVIIMADHGMHFIVGRLPLVPDDSRYQERYLPLFVYVTPKNIPETNLRMLKRNQQYFVNHHDTYATLKSLAVGRRAGAEGLKDYAYLYEPVPQSRDCADDSEGVTYVECWCHNDISKFYAQKNQHGYFYVQY